MNDHTYKNSNVVISLIGPNHSSFEFKLPIPHNQRLIDATSANLIRGSIQILEYESDCPDVFTNSDSFHQGVDRLIDEKPAALKTLEKAIGATVAEHKVPLRKKFPKKKFHKKGRRK